MSLEAIKNEIIHINREIREIALTVDFRADLISPKQCEKLKTLITREAELKNNLRNKLH